MPRVPSKWTDVATRLLDGERVRVSLDGTSAVDVREGIAQHLTSRLHRFSVRYRLHIRSDRYASTTAVVWLDKDAT